ncbi:hypothetical protein BU26DRAFT_239206 [Trematosphaeria pertusa]|uniref:Uncharacterized protein n=1 Tax=Trematosphaeria pertusa TaxID=390896 RepID=A0A6A6HQ22_9PLEO|nr:uncharacterized protein BU26DRAFT_239206 [Trematosphaeria pertusa]KAF2240244.1 hypothetical protein BU26DRAFT_239206 [Trematosphaeria pertusa]
MGGCGLFPDIHRLILLWRRRRSRLVPRPPCAVNASLAPPAVEEAFWIRSPNGGSKMIIPRPNAVDPTHSTVTRYGSWMLRNCVCRDIYSCIFDCLVTLLVHVVTFSLAVSSVTGRNLHR